MWRIRILKSVASGALACFASVLGKVAFDGETAFQVMAKTACEERFPGLALCNAVREGKGRGGGGGGPQRTTFFFIFSEQIILPSMVLQQHDTYIQALVMCVNTCSMIICPKDLID